MEIGYLVLLIVIMIVLFAVLKRPMHEVMLVSFAIVAVISGHAKEIIPFLVKASNNYLVFTIAAFMAFSAILSETGIIRDFINLIIALVGRVSGGAGYMALATSSIFGALSGTGPGCASAVGVVAIPAMKKTGFKAEHAAAVEMAASALAPVIPPSGTVTSSFAVLMVAYPACCTFSQYWVMMWGISVWYIIEQTIVLAIMIKRHKIKPIPKEDRLPLNVALREGWKALLMPVIVFLPFLFDSMFSSTLIASRLGEAGASTFSGALLVMVPSICPADVWLISRKRENRITLQKFFLSFKECVSTISPLILMVIGGFAMSELFNAIGVGERVSALVAGKHIPLWTVAVFVPLCLGLLGMFLEANAVIYMLQLPLMTIALAAGVNPILVAALMSVMSTSLGHMTPPFAPSMYVAMGIAEADFSKTVKCAVVYAFAHYLVTVLILLGCLPILGIAHFVS